MKKIVVWMLLMVFGGAVNAQNQVFLGPSFGLGINKIKSTSSNSINEPSDPLFGFNIAASLELRFNDFFALNTGLFYGKRGGKYDRLSSKLIIHQLEVPILAKAGYGKNRKWQIYGIGGFKLGNGVRAKYVEKISEDLNRNYSLKFGASGNLQRFYFGLAFGGGLSVLLGRGKLIFDCTQDLALTSTFSRNFISNVDNTQRQSNLNFALSYLLPLNDK